MITRDCKARDMKYWTIWNILPSIKCGER